MSRQTRTFPPELAASVYVCWLEALEHAGAERTGIAVRNGDGSLDVEIVGGRRQAGAALERMRDRIEALGGRLTTTTEPGTEIRISCSLPLAE